MNSPEARKPSQLSRAQFVAKFGGVYEHSRWIAEAAHDAGLSAEADSAEGLARTLAGVVAAGSGAQKRALIDAHPDLAGRLARAGQLTADSTREQASAGLDLLCAEEAQRFVALNDAYRAKFGIPFVMAIKGRAKAEILAAFERRLDNDFEVEITTALTEIDRIARLRLNDLLR